jgi:DNA-binding IclR family transcriptional regulator
MAAPAPASEERLFSPPRAIARVLRVIEALAAQPGGHTLAELSVAMGIPKSSLFAILKGLDQEGYVVLDKDTYSIGPNARKLAETIRAGRSFVEQARTILESLAGATGETVILARLTEDRRYVEYAVVVESDSWLRFSVKDGARRPLNSGASGHAVLGWLPDAEREAYLASGPFERFTENTVANPAALKKAVARVRREGAAITIDGTVMGAIGIAAPYFDEGGAIRGSLLIAAPSARMLGREQEVAKIAQQGAMAISRMLGYAGIYPPKQG